jgi:translocation and assembly module TamB
MHTRARPVRTTLQLLWPLAWVLLGLALLVGALGGGAYWLLKREDGARWLLAQLPGVQAEGVRGALLGPRFEADRLHVSWGPGASVTLTGLLADGLAWQWRPQASVWLALDAATLSAREVVVETGPPSATPAKLPTSLSWPLRLAVAALHIGELRVDGGEPLRRIDARVALAPDAHRVEALALEWDRLRLQGQARLETRPPFALAAEAQLAPAAADAEFAASARASGTLERLVVAATLRGQARGTAAAPSADVQATLLPFAPWPLAALSATTQALDLAVLSSAAPQTRLAGRVEVDWASREAPIAATVLLDNTAAGRWDERRLPVRRLALTARGLATQPDRIELTEFDLTLGSGSGRTPSAGRWRGRGEWLGHTLQLDTTLERLQPQRLDGRAPAMTLDGPLAFSLHGLPSPDPAATAAAPPPAIELRSSLDGRLDALPRAVHLTLAGRADAGHIELQQLRAQSGDALAQLQATARLDAGRRWQLSTRGSLADFDPLPWWPGAAGSAWRQGPHRISADWDVDVRLPARAGQLAPLALLQSLAGRGNLRVHDSVLGGVPLALTLALGQTPSQGGTPNTLHGELRLGGNQLTVNGRGDPAGAGTSDRWQLALDAPALASLAPLLRLSPDLADWAPKAGSLQATATAQGRWPELRTEGELRLQQLQSGALGVDRASSVWRVDTGGQALQPLEAQIDVAGVRWGQQRLEQLRGELGGTWREHRLQLSAALPQAPPPLAEQLLAVRAQAGTRVQLQAEGAWQGEAAGGGRWRGGITRLAIGAWEGGALAGETAAQWLDARDLRATLQFGRGGTLERIQADAGRLRLADTASLRWDAILVDLRGAAPNITLRAEIDPFQVAPLLARVQPAAGWGGDLQLAARVEVRAAERFDADVVFERRDGDLSLSDDDGGVQRLGLTALRLGLTAREGEWQFTQAMAGSTLGELAGSVRVVTTPQRRWPTADAPIEGVIEARVASLGTWSGWVPPGWRLAGELRSSAIVGGRFGAPEYTGRLSGSNLAMRNLLQGVNVTQGNVAIQLGGAAANIEQFTFKGGDGTLTVTGGAEFGAAPNARLRVVAERFRVLGRIDRQLTVSGNADLQLQRDSLRLDGRLAVDEGLFDTSRGDAPTLDDDVTVRRAGDREAPEEAAGAARPRRNLAVVVDVDLGPNLRMRGRGLDTALRGQLRITTPGGRLAVNGTVNTEQGTYAAYGQKLDIDRGIVAFSGPVENPRLDILALRANTDMRVGVAITGNAQTPRVRLYSEQDMSDTDKLSWLMLGRPPEGLGRTDSALLQSAAVALLAGEGESPTDNVLKNLGLDELSMRQSEDGDVRETVITLGKQLSRRWYVGYERGVNATTGTWQLIYRIAQRFTVRAQSGLDNSLDVIWTWKIDEVPLPGPPPGVPKSSGQPP